MFLASDPVRHAAPLARKLFMLQRQDYILRLIEQMGRILAHLLSRILNRPAAELGDVEAELNGFAHSAGMDLELARRLTPESLHIMVAPSGDVDPGRCWLLAELLYLHGVHAERRQQAESARQSYVRSLHLYRMAEPEWYAVVELPDPPARVQELEERLQALREAGSAGADVESST